MSASSALRARTDVAIAGLLLASFSACSSSSTTSANAQGGTSNGGSSGVNNGGNAGALEHGGSAGTVSGGSAGTPGGGSSGTANGGNASGGAASGGSAGMPSGGSGGSVNATRKGISGWLYANDAALASELQSYDLVVQSKPDGAERHVRYLFPYGGGLGLTGSAYTSDALSYDPAAAAFYAAKLPNAAMLPIIDSGDGDALATFSSADQEKLAADVAAAIVSDPNARGAHIDIEPFHDEHAPFYAKLKALLHASQKQLTLFTGRTSGPIYSTADIVVLSGYDLGITPVSAAKYQTTLANMVDTALASAASGGSTLLVGIPVSASFEEYATESGACSTATGVSQEQWVGAALQAVCPHQADASYLGVALWQVGSGALEIHSEPGCLRHPDAISDAVWGLLENFDPAHCP